MQVSIFLNPRCEHACRVDDAIHAVNTVQSYFRLSRRDAPWLPHDPTEQVRIKEAEVRKLRKLVESHAKGRPAIAVIQNPFTSNNFSHEYRISQIITLADWESDFAPPPVRVYLAYEFA